MDTNNCKKSVKSCTRFKKVRTSARKGRPGIFDGNLGDVIAFMREHSQACRDAVPQRVCTIIGLARLVNARFLPAQRHTDLTVRQAIYHLVRCRVGKRVVNANAIWTSRKVDKPVPVAVKPSPVVTV